MIRSIWLGLGFDSDSDLTRSTDELGENPSRATTVSSEKSKYVHVMCRLLTISTEIKLAAAFWAGFGRSKIILLAYCPKLNMLPRLFHFLLLQNQSGLSNFFGDRAFSLTWLALCKSIGTKGSIYVRKDFNSHRIGLVQQYGRRFIVFGTPIWQPWRHMKTLYKDVK